MTAPEAPVPDPGRDDTFADVLALDETAPGDPVPDAAVAEVATVPEGTPSTPDTSRDDTFADVLALDETAPGDPAPAKVEPPAQDAAQAKTALRAEALQGLDKARVAELVLALEAQNPTDQPAMSPHLSGKWKFLYAGAGSPGLSALQLLLRGVERAPKSPSGTNLVEVGETFLTIRPEAEQPRAVS